MTNEIWQKEPSFKKCIHAYAVTIDHVTFDFM